MKAFMFNDYCSSKKKPRQNFLTGWFCQKYFLIFISAIFILGLALLAVKQVIDHFYQLKASERVLLLKDKKPVAFLYFDLVHQQLNLIDLRDYNWNFHFDQLQKEASTASYLEQNLFYAFLLNTLYDRSFSYDQDDLDRASLMAFFSKYKSYDLFLQDENILWREQTFDPQNASLIEPLFECPIALINTTPETGLASTFAQMLEKSSFSIIKKDSDNSNLLQSKIIYDQNQPACVDLLSKLQKILPQSLVVIDEKEVTQHRAALVIYLGQDLASVYNFLMEQGLLEKGRF